MPKADIKKFYNDPNCAICNRPVKGWAKAWCDNCHRAVCRKHRPLFVQYWQCPSCEQAQKSFLGQVNTPTQNTEDLIKKASFLMQNKNTKEAQRAIDDIFVDIFSEE